MKKYCWILLIVFAAGLRAADAPKINSPAAGIITRADAPKQVKLARNNLC